MFRFIAKVHVHVEQERAWNYLPRVEQWWLPSNPEHESLQILSEDKRMREGLRIRIQERIAGIPGIAEGTISQIEPGKSVTWQAQAIYRLWLIRVPVQEGVTWAVQPVGEGCELSAEVWAEFPHSFSGKSWAWIFVHLLNGAQKDYDHALYELNYLKEQLERAS